MTDLTRRSVLGAAAAGMTQAQQAGRPNVLFFLPDQVRAQEVGYNGGRNTPTPNIDQRDEMICRGDSRAPAKSTKDGLRGSLSAWDLSRLGLSRRVISTDATKLR